ncbi:MAG: hypothetical protein Q9169_002803 [Polycauliona sp. 2 TL-2023]
MVNYYTVLELPDDASSTEIQEKYKQLHHSKVSAADGSHVDHELVRRAHDMLCFSTRRNEYNKRLGLPPPDSMEPETERTTGRLPLYDPRSIDDTDDSEEIMEQLREAQRAFFASSDDELSPSRKDSHGQTSENLSILGAQPEAGPGEPNSDAIRNTYS